MCKWTYYSTDCVWTIILGLEFLLLSFLTPVYRCDDTIKLPNCNIDLGLTSNCHRSSKFTLFSWMSMYNYSTVRNLPNLRHRRNSLTQLLFDVLRSRNAKWNDGKYTLMLDKFFWCSFTITSLCAYSFDNVCLYVTLNGFTHFEMLAA